MGYTRKQVEHCAKLWLAEIQDAGLLTPVAGVATVHVSGGSRLMSESTWHNGIEVYTHNGMRKCWTCGQRLAYWEEPWELAEWMAEHAHDDDESGEE